MKEKQEKIEAVPQDLTKFVPISHDQFFHEIFNDPDVARAYLEKTLKREAVELLNLEKLEVLPTSFLTREFRELRAVVIYCVPLKTGERTLHFYTILEHKAQNDRWAIFQVTQYVAELERKIVETTDDAGGLTKEFLIPVIIPIIIYHGETPFTGPICSVELHETFVGYEKHCLHLEAILNDLSGVPDEDLPNDPNVPEMNMGMRMMKYIFHKDFKKKFLEILDRLGAYMTVPKYQRFGRLAVFYASCRAKHFDKSDLQDVVKQIPNLMEEKEMSSLMEQLKEEGKAEGRVEGKVEGKVELILLFLSSLGHVPQELVDRIQEVDSSRLNNLALLAPKCKSVEEFEKAL